MMNKIIKGIVGTITVITIAEVGYDVCRIGVNRIMKFKNHKRAKEIEKEINNIKIEIEKTTDSNIEEKMKKYNIRKDVMENNSETIKLGNSYYTIKMKE